MAEVTKLTAQAIVDPAGARADIMRALREEQGHRARAAERLGIGRKTLYDVLRRLELLAEVENRWPEGGRKKGVTER